MPAPLPVRAVEPEKPEAVLPASDQAPPKGDTKAKPKAATRVKVPVTLVLHFVDATEVKIGRVSLTVRRKTDATVPKERHRLRWRRTGETKWHDEGQRNFNSSAGYLVRLRRPA